MYTKDETQIENFISSNIITHAAYSVCELMLFTCRFCIRGLTLKLEEL
jgi:hypothetical protein